MCRDEFMDDLAMSLAKRKCVTPDSNKVNTIGKEAYHSISI